MAELSQAGVKVSSVDSTRLFAGAGGKRSIDGLQRQALLQHSVLAGVVSGGPKLIENTILSVPKVNVTYDSSRAFPFDKIPDFIDCLPSYRDKSMYSLFAASGCRGHEGRQLLFEDVDVTLGEVVLVSPTARRNHPSYLHLTPNERDQLSWKGRTTKETLLIEPFASSFFDNLELYLRHEYVPHGLHQFVFQQSQGESLGRPYFLSDASSRRNIFKRAAARAGIECELAGGHSLRHAYATYTLNYFPRMNGEYGLPLAYVQQLMGHASQRYTAVYAQRDKDLLHEELQYANAMVFGAG